MAGDTRLVPVAHFSYMWQVFLINGAMVYGRLTHLPDQHQLPVSLILDSPHLHHRYWKVVCTGYREPISRIGLTWPISLWSRHVAS